MKPRNRLNASSGAPWAGQFGDEARNDVRDPAFAHVNLSVMKIVMLTERLHAQFRADSLNAVSHTNFGIPIADIASQDFGSGGKNGQSWAHRSERNLLPQ